MKRIDIVHIIDKYEQFKVDLLSSYPIDKGFDESISEYRSRKMKEFNDWLKGEV